MLLLGVNTSTVFASETAATSIKIKDLSVEIPYDTQDIDIIREENLNEVRISFINKETREVLKTIGEITNVVRTDYNKTIYEEYNCGRGIKARLYGNFLMYSSGSFHEIKK